MTRGQKYYARGKARTRDEAIQFQLWVMDERIPWWEYADYQEYLEERGRRFGLLREFRENAII